MLNKTQVSDFKLVALQALIFDYLHPESNTPLWGNATKDVGTDIVKNQVTKAWEISQFRKEHPNSTLTLACLPAHLALLSPRGSALFSPKDEPKVVIGTLSHSEPTEEIISFIKNPAPYNRQVDKHYHAWIKLSNGDIIDLTHHLGHTGSYGYFESTQAKNNSLTYHEIITGPQEVLDFHAKLVYYRFGNSTNSRNSATKYLESFATSQNIKRSEALNYDINRYLLGLSKPQRLRSKFWNFKAKKEN